MIRLGGVTDALCRLFRDTYNLDIPESTVTAFGELQATNTRAHDWRDEKRCLVDWTDYMSGLEFVVEAMATMTEGYKND